MRDIEDSTSALGHIPRVVEEFKIMLFETKAKFEYEQEKTQREVFNFENLYNEKFEVVKSQFDLAHEKTIRERSDMQIKLSNVHDLAIKMKDTNTVLSKKLESIFKTLENILIAEEVKLAMD